MRATAAISSASRRQRLAADGGPTVIAVWDVGASVPGMDAVFEKWNRLKGPMRFVQVFISAPRQALIAGERTVIAAKRFDPQLESQRNVLVENLFVDGAASVAEAAREKGGYDKIALMTPHMLAFSDAGEFHFNYYSVSWDNIIFVSGFDVRAYAQRARRSFTNAMCALLIGQVLENRYDIEPHPENRGCLFDFNRERHTIVGTFEEMRIEPGCLRLIPESDQTYVRELVEILRI